MKINANDTAMVEAWLDNVQANQNFGLLTFENIQSAIDLTESKIELLPKEHRDGVVFTFTVAKRLCNTHSTYCTIEYQDGAWFVIGITRYHEFNNGEHQGWLSLSANQKTKLSEAIAAAKQF